MKVVRTADTKYLGFKSFAWHSFLKGQKLHDPSAPEKFVEQLRADLDEATSSDTFLYGHRTEAMFGSLVAALGEVALLKEEDGAACYAESVSLEIPDFRLVLKDGRQLLVEVKNYHQRDPVAPFKMTSRYFDGLREYAALTKSELRIAVFWSRWRLWSLVAPEAFTNNRESFELSMTDAMMKSEMSLLGDCMVGTVPPLELKLSVEQISSEPGETATETLRNVTIRDVRLLSAGREIEKEVEKKIASFLMFFGRWNVSNRAELHSDGTIASINYEWRPEQETPGQGFEVVGSLSTMFSTFFLNATASKTETAVGQIHAKGTPGELGRLIPEGYRGDSLPLWILHVKTAAKE